MLQTHGMQVGFLFSFFLWDGKFLLGKISLEPAQGGGCNSLLQSAQPRADASGAKVAAEKVKCNGTTDAICFIAFKG